MTVKKISVPIQLFTDEAESFAKFAKDEISGAGDACILLLSIRSAFEFETNITSKYLMEQTGFSEEYIQELINFLSENRFIKLG